MPGWRLPVFAAVAGLASLAASLVLLHPRPGGPTASAGRPAADAQGAAGWRWSHGVPGFEAGAPPRSLNLARVQPLEVQAALLAAIRRQIDPRSVRVVVAVRPNYRGVLAILAAKPAYRGVADSSCLAVLLPADAPVVWQCPGGTDRADDLAHRPVLVAAARYEAGGASALYVSGVARGDVTRVVLEAPGFRRQTLYRRGRTWGEFSAALELRRDPERARLLVYRHRRLAETVSLALPAGAERAL